MTVYLFATFEYHQEAKTLLKDGERRPIRPKTAELLELFLVNRGHLIPKQQLFAKIWDNANTSEAVLFQTISDLRKTLGSSAKHPKFISNIKGKGYIWDLCDVEQREAHREGSEDPELAQPFSNPLDDPNQSKSEDEKTSTGPDPSIAPKGSNMLSVAAISLLVVFLGFILALDRIKTQNRPSQPIRVLMEPIKNQTGQTHLSWVEHGLADIASTMLSGVEEIQIENDATISSESESGEYDKLGNTYHAVMRSELHHEKEKFVIRYAIFQRDGAVLRRSYQHEDLLKCLERTARGLSLELAGIDPQEQRESFFIIAAAADAYCKAMEATALGELEKASCLFEQAIQLEPGIVQFRVPYSLLLTRMGQEEKATRLLEQANNEAKRHNHLPHLRICQKAWSTIAELQGNKEEALRTLENLVSSSKSRGLDDPASQLDLIDAYIRMGYPEKAKHLLENGALAKGNFKQTINARRLQQMGRLARYERDWDDADKYIKQAQLLFRNFNQLSGQQSCQFDLIQLRLMEGNYDQAARLLDHILSEQAGDRLQYLEHLLDVGEKLLGYNQYPLAMKCLNRAQAILGNAPLPKLRLRLYFRLAEVYLSLDSPDQGETYLRFCTHWLSDSPPYGPELPWLPNALQNLRANYRQKFGS